MEGVGRSAFGGRIAMGVGEWQRRHRQQGDEGNEPDPLGDAVGAGTSEAWFHSGNSPYAVFSFRAILLQIEPDGSLATARRFDDRLGRNCDSPSPVTALTRQLSDHI
jgi:hypothetical protein